MARKISSGALDVIGGLLNMVNDPERVKKHVDEIKAVTADYTERFKTLQKAGADLDAARLKFDADMQATKDQLAAERVALDSRAASIAEDAKKLAADQEKFARFEKATSANLAERELAVATKEESVTKWRCPRPS